MILSKKQNKILEKLAEKYDLKLILLFGSYASGKTHKNSDFDIAVFFDREKREVLNLDDELGIIAKLTDSFEKKIDLSVINHANPLLLKQISRNCRLLFGNVQDFNNFNLFAFHRYNDYAPFFAMESRFVSEQIRKLK